MRRAFLLFLSVLLLVSCAPRGRVRTESTIGTDVVQMALPGKEVTHPEHGKEVWFGIGPMAGSSGTKANGVAETHVFADGFSIVSVRLNIEPPKDRTVFFGWLRKPEGSERIKIGELDNPLRDVRHQVVAEVGKDLRAYTMVDVTRGPSGNPSEDDPIVASGELKDRTR